MRYTSLAVRRHCMAAIAFSAAAALAAFAAPALSQSYPSKPIKLVVPFSPGGGSDSVARVIAQNMSQRLGQQVLVENRPGAGGSIGATMVAKSRPDGYTLLLGSSSEVVVLPSFETQVQYDSAKDYVAIGRAAIMPLVLVASERLPVKSLQDIIGYAKANPGKVTYGSAGNGSTTHLAMELFASMAGIKLTHVPYKGSVPVVTDLLNGNLDMALSTIPAAIPHAKGGKLKLLAVSTDTRVGAMPNVPTVAEAGVKGYATAVWTGILAPVGTPQDIVETLHREMTDALAQREVKEVLARQGAEVAPSTPAEFAAQIRSDLGMWTALVKERGIKGD